MGTTCWILRLHSDGRLLVGRDDPSLEHPLDGFKQVAFVEDAGDIEKLGPGFLAVAMGRGAGKTIASVQRLAAKVDRRGAAGLLIASPFDQDALEDLPSPTGGFPIFIKPRDLDWSAVLQPILNLHPDVGSNPNPDRARRQLVFEILDMHGRLNLSAEQARAVGLDLGEPIRIMVVQPASTLEAPLLDRLEEVIAVELLDHDPLSTTLTYEGSVVGTESVQPGRKSPVPGRLLFKARNAMSEAVVVGVGTPHPGVEGLFRSFREAMWAARVGRHGSGPNTVTDFDELGANAWLEPFAFAANGNSYLAIEQLSAHDALHGTRLVETLIAYLMSGRAKEAADQLFIHRNTLRYRLECIRKLTGLDPHQHGSRLVLDLQLRLATAQGAIPTPDAINGEIRRSRDRRTPVLESAQTAI